MRTFRLRLIWLFVLCLALAACSGGPAELPCAQDPLCLSYAISADIPILDPHIADSPEAGMILRQLYDTLVMRHSKTLEFLPGLAHAWEKSADGLTYTFHLREGIRFHDGTVFTSASVAANIDRIYAAETGSQRSRRLLGAFSRYEIVDGRTIRFHMSAPFAPLLDSLSQPFLGIAAESALRDYDRLRYQFHQVGSGPFALESYMPGEKAVLRRNRGYAADPAFYPQLNRGEVERVEFVIAASESPDADAIVDAEFDIVDDIAPAAAASLAANSRLQALPIAIPGQPGFLLFNTNHAHLDRREVRLALLRATNRIGIANEIYFNFSPVGWAPLAAATGYAHSGYENRFAYDLSAAAELLRSVGYEEQDGRLSLNGAPLELSLVAPPWGKWREVADALRESWARIGIGLSIDSVPGERRLLEKARAGDSALIAIDNYGLDPAILGLVFAADSVYGAFLGADEELAQMLLDAQEAQDPAARRNLYYAIQARLMSETLLLPIRDGIRVRSARSSLTGLRFDAYGFYPLLRNVVRLQE